MNDPILSIITVCFNAEKTIHRTITSIYNQTFTNYEYIIVDGASSDETYNIVCKFDELFKKKNINYVHISEPDKGIYNAMNKAVGMAQGSWISFMNADDCYSNDEVLSAVFKNNIDSHVGILYGNTIYVTEGKKEYEKARPINEITRWMVFCHQSAFVRNEIQKKYMFDEKYRYAADYNMLLRCYLDGISFKYLDLVVADFSCQGLTGNLNNKYKIYIEYLNIQEANGILNQKSIRIRLRKIFHYFRLKSSYNYILKKIFEMIVNVYQKK